MIECKNLSMRYKNNFVFENFNHNFQDNSITVIMGTSGKGKTTLIRCIAGLNKPTSGEVIYNNKKITGPLSDICMMHQHYSNFPWKTCLDNILFPLSIKDKVTKEHVSEAKIILKKLGLEQSEQKYPSELSGGMNQRLALARMLISKPKVVLMDEPLSALDQSTRSDIQDLILKSHRQLKNTMIMITHDINEAEKMANNIIKL